MIHLKPLIELHAPPACKAWAVRFVVLLMHKRPSDATWARVEVLDAKREQNGEKKSGQRRNFCVDAR